MVPGAPRAGVPGGLHPDVSPLVGQSHPSLPTAVVAGGKAGLPCASTSLIALCDLTGSSGAEIGAQRLLFECEITLMNLNRLGSSSARGGIGVGQTLKVRRDQALPCGTETPCGGPASGICDLRRLSESQHKETN